MSHLVLRTVRPHDLKALDRIEELCFGDDRRYPIETLAGLIMDGNVSGIVAEDDGTVVGFLFLFLDRMPLNSTLLTIDVHPEWRGKKVGSKLLDHACEIATGLKYKRMLLQVGIENLNAQKMYLSKGFLKTGVLKEFYGKDRDAWEMEMSL